MSINNETIVAPITPPGAGAVAAVRVSGPDVPQIIRVLSPKAEQILAHPRSAVLSPIFDLLALAPAEDRPVLDYGLLIYYRSPASYTGEEVLEVYLHGSPYLLRRLVQGVAAAGARAAKPGEFTERAFHHGKLDLTQAEAIADLIASETEAQARIAREQLEGRLSGAISDLGEPLRDLLAEIEARIDFPEEGIEAESLSGWQAGLASVLAVLERYCASYEAGKLWRDGAAVAIIGAPNAGKSSLLNVLLGEDRAIVTPIPGTTRDTIEERLVLNGIFVRLFDTAGIDAAAADSGRRLDQVEQLGVERSWSKARNADLILFLIDAAEAVCGPPDSRAIESGGLLFKQLETSLAPIMVIGTKLDLLTDEQQQAAVRVLKAKFGRPALLISALSGAGIPALSAALSAGISQLARGTGELLISNQRHLEAILAAKNSVAGAITGLKTGAAAEFVSLDIRSALSSLNEIIGVTRTEDILGRIFSKFCIGK